MNKVVFRAKDDTALFPVVEVTREAATEFTNAFDIVLVLDGENIRAGELHVKPGKGRKVAKVLTGN